MNEHRCGNCIELEIVSKEEITMEIIGSCDDIPEYEGPYTVTPKRIDQELKTANTRMKEDVTVKEIPYAEIQNAYGTTATIAS